MNNENFFGINDIVAVVGVSANPEKWGRKIFESLKKKKFDVFAVNPRHDSIDGNKCYPDILSLPKKPDLIITVTPPDVTVKVLEQCIELGVEKVWVQPGSESEEAKRFAEANGLNAIFNACILIEKLGERND